MNKKESQSVIVNIKPAVAVITPYAMANISDDLFRMGENFIQGKIIPLAQYYVYCASIEIGLKSAILAIDCTKEKKKLIKDMGHDLVAARLEFEKTYQSLWDASDLEVVENINPFFKHKGLEYFTLDVLTMTLRGFKELPEISKVANASQKVNDFIVDKEFFFEANTTQEPGRGWINVL